MQLYCIAASINLGRLREIMSDTFPPTETLPLSDSPESPGTPANPAAGSKPTERPALDPTRYGDWEKNGRCIDF